MADIQFSTGLTTYNLNGACEVAFNPTDSAFAEKLYMTFEALDKKQEAYRKEVESVADKKEIFDVARARDQEMRGMIDDLFGAPVCDAVFGKMNVYALSDGLPVWCNLMFAVMDEMDATFAREQKLTNPRIAKYTSKYQKKYHS